MLKKHMSWLPGLRIIKTIVAVGICLFITHIFEWLTPFYACIAAVLMMKESPEESMSKGMNRIRGTILGGIMGGVFLILTFYFKIPAMSPSYQMTLVLGLLLCLTIAKSLKFTEYATSMSAILLLSVMLNHSDSIITMLEYSMSRMLETILGIAIAVVVNRYLNFNKTYAPKH